MTDLTPGDAVDSMELFGEVAPYRVEVDADRPREVSVVWTEDLDFHVNTRGLAVLADADGEVADGVTEVLQDELRRLLDSDEVYVSRSDQDEPAVEVLVGLTLDEPSLEVLGEAAWPVVATLTNVMDPGTFGAEYVMGYVAGALEGSR